MVPNKHSSQLDMLLTTIKKLFFGVKLVRYGIIGGGSFAIEYGMFLLLLFLWKEGAIIANLVAMIVSMVFNFTMNKFWTFKVSGSTAFQAFRYGIVFLVNVGITSILLRFIPEFFGISELIVKLVLMIVLVGMNFILSSVFIYANKPR